MASSTVVLRTYSIPEAVVAASMLTAYGLMPVVSEYHFAHQMWTRMFAVQGLRVMVPGDLVEVATRLLVPLYPNRAQPPWPSRRDTICAVIFCFALGGVIFPYWVRRNWMWPPAEAAASSDEPTASG